MDDCRKLQVDNGGLRARDCHGCSDREYCIMRANTFSPSTDPYSPRIRHIERILLYSKVVQLRLSDITPDEARDLALFEGTLNRVQSHMASQKQQQQQHPRRA